MCRRAGPRSAPPRALSGTSLGSSCPSRSGEARGLVATEPRAGCCRSRTRVPDSSGEAGSVQYEDENGEDGERQSGRQRDEERDGAQEARQRDERAAPASAERAPMLGSRPPPEEHRGEPEDERERHGHQRVLQADLVEVIGGHRRGAEDAEREQSSEKGPDCLRVRHGVGGYCLTYGRPAAAGPRERPITPTSAISVRT